MSDDRWADLTDGDTRRGIVRLKKALEEMHLAAAKPLKAERAELLISRMLSLRNEPALWEVLEQATDKCECPSPAKIRELVAAIQRQRKPPPEQYQPTDDERARSLAAALKTALWLHYEKGWSFDLFGREMLGSALKRQERLTDAELAQALEAAKRKHPRESIAVWMQEQNT